MELEDSRSEEQEIDDDYSPWSFDTNDNDNDHKNEDRRERTVDASKVPTLMAIFPHISVDQACDALHQSKNDLEVACTLLLE